jgi:outer membrane protein TolC
MRSAVNSLRARLVPLAVVLVTHAAQAETVRLEALEQRAVSNRASMAAARARVDGAQARIDLARAPYYPTLSARAGVNLAPGGRLVSVQDYREARSNPNAAPYRVSGARALGTSGAFEPDLRYETTLSLGSRLYDFGRTAANVRAARADREATVAAVRSEGLSITLEVRAAYLGWLSARATRDILAQTAREATALRENVQAHVAEGSRPGAELASARLEETRAALDLDRGEGALEAARLDVEQATGEPLSKTAEPDLSLLDRTASPVVRNAHPDVTMLERRSEAASATAEAHTHRYAPIVAAGVDAGVRGQATTAFPLYQLGLSVTVPLLDGGVESASAAQASAQARELAAQAREVRSQVALATERARQSYERAARRLELSQRLVAEADETVQHAADERALGSGTFAAVAEARMVASRARLEVLAARLERARAVLELSGPQ